MMGACREQAHNPAPKQASNLLTTEYMEEVEIGEQSRAAGRKGGRERASARWRVDGPDR